ncbi:MAG: M36 family metallopeptidase [Kofleriaceae bacterium]
MINRRRLVSPVLACSLALGCSEPTPPQKPAPTDSDPTAPATAADDADAIGAAITLGATPMSIDETGVPQLLIGSTIANLRGPTPTASARAYVARLAPAWNVRAGEVPVLDTAGDIRVRGGTITRVRPTIDGLPIEGGELRVLVRPDGSLAAIGGKLYGTAHPRSAAQFSEDDAGALAHAMRHTYKSGFDRGAIATQRQRGDGTRLMRGKSGGVDVQLAQARKVWFPTGGALVAAWIVESYASMAATTSSDAWRTVVAADDGRVLAHRSLVVDATFAYRVFANASTKQMEDGPHADFSPHPTGTPNGSYPAYAPSALVSVDGLNTNPGGTPDPWLVAGKTVTSGNNTDTYADLATPDGFSTGDLRATTTAAGTFDRVFDTGVAAGANATQRAAAVTALFYGINWLHDFWYDAGFTEAAGNAQLSNFGRGGVEGDALLAEAQDFSGTNNANMSTPSDGLPPRMQVFVWDGPVNLDGSLDAGLLAHEFGHYVHHRLSLCGQQLCSGMSEGYGDFLALMMIARAGDNFASGVYPFGVYVTQEFSPDPAYYGIRRAPYSKSTTRNALMFRHMGAAALPTTHPILNYGDHAEPHNAGEIWAEVLWEAYVSIQQAGGTFADNHRKMADYLVAGMLLMPADHTPTEARDGILAAARAASIADHDVIAAAFARRGFGTCAVSPTRTSTTNAGIVESTTLAGRAVFGTATVSDTLTTCDGDGVLDAGETVQISVPIANGGPGTLTGITATLTSSTPGVTVAGPVSVSNIGPYGSRNAVITVSLAAGVTVPTAGSFNLSVTSSGGCASPTAQAFGLRMNVDDVPASSATETFDAGTSVWTTNNHWQHVRLTPLDGSWHGPAVGFTADYSVTTPQLAVGTGAFSFSYSHSFVFELGSGVAYDGGVVELSTNNGATWADVTTFGANPMYTGTITDESNNPLPNRPAYTGTRTTQTRTLSFGTQLANQSVRLRFRIATDGGVGTTGWHIDDVQVAGITNTPFPTQIPDRATCGGGVDAGVPDAPLIDGAVVIDAATPDAATPDAPPTFDAAPDAPIDAKADASPTGPDAPGNPDDGDGGGSCDSRPIGAGNLGLAFGVLAMLFRSRRRRLGAR